MNPRAGLRPISSISDRAKRYRAQHASVRPAPPKRCGYCGSRSNVVIDHINGREEDLSPKNLMWACRRCNTKKGAVLKRAGLGRRVVQLNPATNRSLAAYGAAIKVMRGEWEGDVGKAVALIRATPSSVRSQFTSRGWKTRKAIYGPRGRAGGGDVPF